MKQTTKQRKDIELLASTYIDEAELIRSITKESFYEFVREFWDTIITEEPIWNWHIEYLCNEAQIVCERMFKNLPREYDLVVNVSPGTTKSTILSVMLPAWIWTRKQSAISICGSYTKDLAMDLSLKSRDVILSEKYMTTYPFVRIRQDQKAKSEFMNTKRGKRISVGVCGSIMGKHADIIIIDDPLNPQEAVSETSLKTANTWMTDTLSTRKKDKAITPTILIMQRLHQNDPSANMITKAEEHAKLEKKMHMGDGIVKIKHICLPAELTDKVKPRCLRSKYKDGLMDPIRLSREVLLGYRAKGEYMYAGQFLQWPVPAGGLMFDTSKIEIKTPPKGHWKKRIRYWDNAATAAGGAFTAGTLMGEDEHGKFWILDVQRFQLGTAAREEKKKQTAIIDGQDVWIGLEQEPGSGGKDQVYNTIKGLAGYRVHVDKVSTDKVVRADAFSVQVNYGNVSMAPGEWNQAYINELEFFPESTYKDQVDTSSGGFNFLAVKQKVAGPT